ncbi:hypothetical protein BZG36_00099 [Bifiguratus adelaidae]|uniref:GST C-terminal domain-containing protein n=1 Tax=Bifiguratus adelaidae TaxID=1938954 RepID=A0A261Y8Y0_9FUNG|nr:hypothetical protein BZG36_00099 [Bifiguratus adelaidae]
MLQLLTWGGALDCPSLDPACLAVETYIRLSGLPYQRQLVNNPNASPTGDLPVLIDDRIWVSGYDRVMSQLIKTGNDLDKHLTAQQKALAKGYMSLLQTTMQDCLLFSWYHDAKNYTSNIRPSLAHLIPFPYRYIVPMQMRKRAKARLVPYGVELTEADKNRSVFERAREANRAESVSTLMEGGWHHMFTRVREGYKTLQTKLGDQKFFFGDSPSTLDCVAFGYLSLHYFPKLARDRLRIILEAEFPSLAKYIERMRDLYESSSTLSSPPPTAETKTPVLPSFFNSIAADPWAWFQRVKSERLVNPFASTETGPKKSQAELDFERKRVWSIAAGVFSVVVYVVWNGLVRIEKIEDGDEAYDSGMYDVEEDEEMDEED